ncbi:hypothetical protein H180DRAFT_03677 [Streptomyces sp. WMMB 322]|nr:hypothetical protein H180DRAFT_03677 [Streptomyces sp. WMMB 322]
MVSIYWDQASVLMQTGLLNARTAAGLPVAVDQRGTLTDGPPNQLAGRTRARGDRAEPPHRRRAGPADQATRARSWKIFAVCGYGWRSVIASSSASSAA